MKIITALVLMASGIGLGMYLDICKEVESPPLYWFIGGVTSVLTLLLLQMC